MSGFALGALASPGTTHPPQPPPLPLCLPALYTQEPCHYRPHLLRGPWQKSHWLRFTPPFFARGRPATSVTSTRRVPRSGPRREDYSTDRNRWQSRKSTCGLSLLWLDPPTTPPTRLLLPHYHYPQPPPPGELLQNSSWCSLDFPRSTLGTNALVYENDMPSCPLPRAQILRGLENLNRTFG